jgi:endonuclease YncB( thermonuclease family)
VKTRYVVLGWLIGLLATALGNQVATGWQSTPAIVVPCKIVDIHDGDTLTVDVTFRVNVRLLDCWAPEVTGDERDSGLMSKAKLESLAASKAGLLTVPLGDSLGKSLTFGRVLARISVDGKDLSDSMVAAGAATKTKEN